MSKIKLNVKNDSVLNFLKDNLVDFKESKHGETTPYNLLEDEMTFKSKYSPGDVVIIQLQDIGSNSRKSLLNIYTYEIERYDDINVKAILIDFKVELIKN